MVKKLLCVFLSVLMLTSLVGCAGEKKNGKYKIVCSVFPIYDWVVNCVDGIEGVEVSFIVDGGTDTHSYNATTGDIAAISEADMLIYVGGSSDAWIEKVLSNLKNDTPKTLKLIDSVCKLSHGHGYEHNEEDHEHSAYDEHVWLSLKNASSLVKTVSATLSEELPASSERIAENSKKYTEKIDALDAELAKKDSVSADKYAFVRRQIPLQVSYRGLFAYLLLRIFRMLG